MRVPARIRCVGALSGARVLVASLALVAGSLPAPEAAAHPLEPSLLEIHAKAGGADLRWKRPAGVEALPLAPWMDGCTWIDAPRSERLAGGDRLLWTVSCEGELPGRRLGIHGLPETRATALVRAIYADGRIYEAVLSASKPSLELPAVFSRFDVARQYLTLGVEHILSGLDHLLFVFGLLLLVRLSTRPLLKTITAFTVGHSITLSAAMLGFVQVPSSPVELAIALSVFALAVELSRESHEEVTRMQRMPWLMSGLFGLLHGFGFAGALAAVGLPFEAIPLALVSFNAGIEIGQLVFVTGVLLFWSAAGRLFAAASMRRLAVHVLGSLSAMWCFERAVALFA